MYKTYISIKTTLYCDIWISMCVKKYFIIPLKDRIVVLNETKLPISTCMVFQLRMFPGWRLCYGTPVQPSVTSVTALISRTGIQPLNMTLLVLRSCGSLKSIDWVLKCFDCGASVFLSKSPVIWGYWRRILCYLAVFAPSKTSTSERMGAIVPKGAMIDHLAP